MPLKLARPLSGPIPGTASRETSRCRTLATHRDKPGIAQISPKLIGRKVPSLRCEFVHVAGAIDAKMFAQQAS